MTPALPHTATPDRKPLRVLLVEDSAIDAGLIIRELENAGYDVDWQRVETAAALREALVSQPWDVVLSDYTMPRFSGLEALKIVKASGLDLPFIVISGAIGEETAVEAMRVGAYDYLLKDRLTRLGSVVERTLGEAAERRARRRAEEALVASEMRYRRLFEAAQDGILILDARTGQVLDVNPFLLDLLGYSLETFLGKALWEIGLFRDIASSQEAFLELREKGYIRYEDLPLETRDGRRIEVEFVSNVYWANDEKVIQCNIRDVSARKRVEAALIASEEKFRLLTEKSVVGVYVIQDAKMAYVNPRFAEFFGYTPEEINGILTPRDLIHPDDIALVMQQLQHRLEGKVEEGNTAYRGIRKDGSQLDIEVYGMSIEYEGKPAVLGTLADVTARKRAEAALRESERFARATLDGLSAHIAILDETGTILAVNRSWRAFAEENPPVTANVNEGANYLAVCDQAVGASSEGAGEFAAGIRAVLSGELDYFELEYPCHSPDEQRWFVVRVTRFPGEGPVRAVIAHENTTQLKLAELKLAAEHHLLRTLIDSLPDRIYAKDAEGRFILKNESSEHLMGAASPDETLGKTDFDYYPPELAAQYATDDQAVIQTGQPLINREEPVVDADGNQGWILTTKVPLFDNRGKVIGLVGIGRDITKRKQMEKALQQERNLLRTLIDTLPDYIFVKDRQGRFVVSNLAHTQTVPHATLAGFIGKTSLELYPLELGQHFHADDIEVMDSGEMLINAERQTYNPDGTRRWVLTTKVPLKDTDGQIVGLVGISRDITERKRLADSERDARILAEALRDTAAVLTSTLEPDRVMARILENAGRVVPHDYASIMLIEGEVAYPAYCRGWLPDEEATFRTVRFPLDTSNLREMILTNKPMIIPDIATYPGWVHVVSHMRAYIGVPIRVHDRVVGFLDLLSPKPGFFTPVHAERLRAFADQAATAIENAQLYEELRRYASELEQRVQERTAQLNHAKERIEAILNSSSDIMVVCRADGTIDQSNPAFEKAFGTGSGEALRQSLTQLVISGHIPVLEQALGTVVETMQPTRVEVTVHYKGGATFDADVVLSPVVEHNDQLLGIVCSLRNITERRRMEDQLRRTLEHEMELSELKTRYVSMAAHDLRNPLAVIQSSVGLLRQYSDRLTDEQKQANYDRIQISIKIMVDMLNDILTIGQVESGTLRFDPAPLDLITFCQDMVAEAQQATMTAQQISFSGQGTCDTAHLDAKLLRHILGNLLSNAIKYSLEGGTVTFTVDCESDQIIFCIQDQGIGIPRTDQARLFEAFHRASNTRKVPGTGLGLAIVKQSVDLHGGTITFESEEGVGTTFTVILPQTSTEK